ncbi:MAG: DUF3237 domain-containing protein [Dehalococcoidales bacterium]|nr:MAG: DUF3237 domain-containing protein [Dehalococcoidales bacterium]
MSDIRTEFLFHLVANLDRVGVLEVGTTPHGTRRIFYVTGGTLEGPRIKGTVLPGGGDWMVVRPDGVGILDVRAVFHTDDDHLIYSYYRGMLVRSAEVTERMQRFEQVDPSEYYFRTTPVFETASEKYGWLNKIVAVGTGLVSNEGVEYDVYSIL